MDGGGAESRSVIYGKVRQWSKAANRKLLSRSSDRPAIFQSSDGTGRGGHSLLRGDRKLCGASNARKKSPTTNSYKCGAAGRFGSVMNAPARTCAVGSIGLSWTLMWSAVVE